MISFLIMLMINKCNNAPTDVVSNNYTTDKKTTDYIIFVFVLVFYISGLCLQWSWLGSRDNDEENRENEISIPHLVNSDVDLPPAYKLSSLPPSYKEIGPQEEDLLPPYK